jgi:general secretion pathway protein F
LRINQAVAATRWQDKLPLRRGKIPSREVVNFTQELAALLKAGLPLDRSLQALEHVTSRTAMKAVLSQVLRDLQEG